MSSSEAEITEIAERLAKQIGVEVHISHGTWVEFAVTTHGETCPRCGETQETGPNWDWVEHASDEQSPLQVIGTSGRPCAGCGQYGAGWLETGATDLSEVENPEDAMQEMLYTLTERHDVEVGAVRKKIRDRLIRDLADAILERDEVVGDEEPVGCNDHNDAAWITGSETNPGVYQADSGLEAWDWDPTDPGEAISVSEHDSDGYVTSRLAGIVESVRAARRADAERQRAAH